MSGTLHSRRMRTWIEDAGALLLAVFLVPVAIIAVGAPVALLVRLVIEVFQRI